MDFVNIYDDNGIDIIIRTSSIKKIERGPRDSAGFGVTASDVKIDHAKVIARKK